MEERRLFRTPSKDSNVCGWETSSVGGGSFRGVSWGGGGGLIGAPGGRVSRKLFAEEMAGLGAQAKVLQGSTLGLVGLGRKLPGILRECFVCQELPMLGATSRTTPKKIGSPTSPPPPCTETLILCAAALLKLTLPFPYGAGRRRPNFSAAGTGQHRGGEEKWAGRGNADTYQAPQQRARSAGVLCTPVTPSGHNSVNCCNSFVSDLLRFVAPPSYLVTIIPFKGVTVLCAHTCVCLFKAKCACVP